jgi:MFS transporter, DHA1 family, inner membrane transport protein
MSFFGNDAINRVNIHTGIQALADGAGGVFVLVFLLRAGVPTPLVFLTMAAMTAVRFLLRPLVVIVAKRIGLRESLILGTVVEAALFPMLPMVQGPDAWLVAVIVVGAIGSVFHWTCYHAYFAALGDAEHRGGQVGAREALSAIAHIVGPLLGAAALMMAGPTITFALVGLIQVLAAVPLLGTPRIPIAREAPGGARQRLFAATLLATDGWLAGCFLYVWQIALFVALSQSYQGYGGAMALAGLAGAASGMVIGRLVDLGHGRRSALFGFGFGVLVVVLRAVSLDTPWLAVIANALGPLFVALYIPALMTPVYNLAKQSPCPLRFHVATEGGWDIGCTAACVCAALLTWAGQPLSTPILLALLGSTASLVMLLRAYRN